ncbi:hypothetical protein ACQKMD_12870 [Viridibacillus sp. NPDC096237]|uniref:hypothetical protein n=1 Tax=Viridibacillus sp. NPDC096237 TaxID=3390721 RepID=UPI003CFCE9F6
MKNLRRFEGQTIYLQDSLGKDLMRTVYMSVLIETDYNFIHESGQFIRINGLGKS